MWGKSKKTWNVPFDLWFFGKQTYPYGFWVVPAFALSFSMPRIRRLSDLVRLFFFFLKKKKLFIWVCWR
jgi:hypothetical protein